MKKRAPVSRHDGGSKNARDGREVVKRQPVGGESQGGEERKGRRDVEAAGSRRTEAASRNDVGGAAAQKEGRFSTG